MPSVNGSGVMKSLLLWTVGKRRQPKKSMPKVTAVNHSCRALKPYRSGRRRTHSTTDPTDHGKDTSSAPRREGCEVAPDHTDHRLPSRVKK